MPEKKYVSLRIVDEKGRTQTSSELKQLNRLRSSMDLKPIRYEKQNCLVCEDKYMAQFIGEKKVNRLCTPCSKRG